MSASDRILLRIRYPFFSKNLIESDICTRPGYRVQFILRLFISNPLKSKSLETPLGLHPKGINLSRFARFFLRSNPQSGAEMDTGLRRYDGGDARKHSCFEFALNQVNVGRVNLQVTKKVELLRHLQF